MESPVRLISKPLLMPLLILLYAREKLDGKTFTLLMICALFFSWLGDIFLLFEQNNSLYFILGLSSFLTAHMLYIIYFVKIRSSRVSYFRKQPALLTIVVAYVFALVYLIWPKLGALKLPVLIYAITIGTMLFLALWQYGRLNNKISILFISGAILFVLSDSALALNRFYYPSSWSGAFVMLTYVAAQILLTMGSISHLRKKPDL